MRPPRCRLACACLGVLCALASSDSLAGDPPPRASAAAVAERVGDVVSLAEGMDSARGPGSPAEAAKRGCHTVGADLEACDLAGIDRCHEALREILRSSAAGPTPGDSLSGASRRHLWSEAADAVVRLSGARAAAAAGRCGATAPPGATPAAVAVLGRRTIRFRPLVALRGGRRWSLVLEGLDPTARARLDVAVPASTAGGRLVPAGAFLEPWREAEVPGRANEEVAVRFIRRLEREAAGRSAASGSAGVQLRTPEPLGADDFANLRAYFAPGERHDAVATFEVADPRADLLSLRTRLRERPCPEARLEPFVPEAASEHPKVGAYLRGRYPSWRLEDGPVTEPIDLELLLALPDGYAADTPVVVLVDGHEGSARRVLEKHGWDLTERGMAVLAVDLPAHGSRRHDGSERFFDPQDPAVLVGNLRQAVLDVLAVIRVATECGLALPDGTTYRPREIRYLGYSLGAVVGSIARSVEPRLGTTVLLGVGGDLFGWQTLRIAHALDTPLVTCLGGPDHGRSCFGTGTCRAPGTCRRDPRVLELTRQLELPHDLIFGGVDPIEFASLRTGPASHAPLLLITAGEDAALVPMGATRLADAYGMRMVGPHARRGPHSMLVQWPALTHGLRDVPGVRRQAYDFLASRGRRRPSRAWNGGIGAPSAMDNERLRR